MTRGADPFAGPIVGVDVGGTFTDLACSTRRAAPSAPPRPLQPRRRGGRLHRGPEPPRRHRGLRAIIHGTTVGTNALLERKGAKIGLITTPGFRDALEMRRRDRPNTWGLWGDFEPVCPRELRLEFPSARWPTGRVRQPVRPVRGGRGGAGAAGGGRGGARHRLRQRLRQPGQRARRLRGRQSRLAERPCRAFGAAHARDPRVRAHLDDGAERLSPAVVASYLASWRRGEG